MDERDPDAWGDDPDRDDGRDQEGRFLPARSGNPGTQWGADNPPPRSPGRPRKDAWVGNLERMLESDFRLSDALAARLAKIALKGRDGDALKAIALIQDRVAGGLVRKVEAEVHVVPHTIELVDVRRGRDEPKENDDDEAERD